MRGAEIRLVVWFNPSYLYDSLVQENPPPPLFRPKPITLAYSNPKRKKTLITSTGGDDSRLLKELYDELGRKTTLQV
jgi:hypothetical protein